MPNRTTELLNFGRLGRRHLQANFDGGDLSSDGGLMLLRQIDARTGLSRMAAGALTDRRAAGRVHHRLRDVLAQRLYGLCCGYEDLNDHDRSEEHTSELQSLMRISYAVFCLKKKKKKNN